MPRLPFLSDNVEKQRRIITEFKGYNRTPRRNEGEFCDMMNMSCDMYPYITVRQGRGKIADGANVHSLGAKEKLYYIKNNAFYYDGESKFSVSEGRKKYAHIGRYIIVMPDKMYYDDENDDYGYIDNEYISGENEITFGTGYLKTSGDKFEGFCEGDGITISGADDDSNNISAVIKKVEDKKITFTTDNIFVEGKSATAVTIKREMPDIEYVCEFSNRLWGCKGNDIYCSDWGNPFNFNVFDGTSAQSWTTSVGTDGDFTGMVSFMSHLTIFKENCIHKIYGDNPNNYEVVTTTCQGVEYGADGTITVVDETVLYKGVKGVYAYTGGMPVLISDSLGTSRFESVCAGTDLTKYYIRMDCDGKTCLCVYDPTYGIWCKEDNTVEFNSFATLGGKLYGACSDGIYEMCGDDKGTIEWSFELEFNETVIERKGYGKLQIRYSQDDTDGFAKLEIKHDDEPFREIELLKSYKKTSVVPVPIRRSDRLTLRFSGKGGFTLETLVRKFYSGSDI